MGYEIHLDHRPAVATASLRKEIARSEMSEWIGEAIGRIFAVLGPSGVHPTGPMYCRYHTWDGDRTDCEVGFPVSGPVPEGVDASELPAGRSAVTVHTGPYEGLAGAYEALTAWIEQNAVFGAAPYELYLDDPEQTEPEHLRTEVVWPLG